MTLTNASFFLQSLSDHCRSTLLLICVRSASFLFTLAIQRHVQSLHRSWTYSDGLAVDYLSCSIYLSAAVLVVVAWLSLASAIPLASMVSRPTLAYVFIVDLLSLNDGTGVVRLC